MDSKEYVKQALITESGDGYKAVMTRLQDVRNVRLLHASMGIAGEGGEVADAIKKVIFYGKKLDAVNLAEECGDLFWYIAVACDELGIDFEKVMEMNIAKLRARYGEKFTEHAAANRDKQAERDVMEKSL